MEVPEEKKKAFESKMKGVPFGLLGRSKKGKTLLVKGLKEKTIIKANIDRLKSSWKAPFKKLMHEEG